MIFFKHVGKTCELTCMLKQLQNIQLVLCDRIRRPLRRKGRGSAGGHCPILILDLQLVDAESSIVPSGYGREVSVDFVWVTN